MYGGKTVLNSVSNEADNRVVRVFISSTFKDMQQERDELVKKVFPVLKKLCDERDITWRDVDLRWGITDEQKAEGSVLPICLEEINRCRPFFIGLLGERYGWVPDRLNSDLENKQPWIKKAQGCSVTEMEILYGVLNNPDMANNAFFYIRDPKYIESLDDHIKHEFIETPYQDDIERFGEKVAKERSDIRKQKLYKLKERIISSGFPVRTNYSNPKELGQMVLQDMTKVIDNLYPKGFIQNPLKREERNQLSYAKTLSDSYIERTGLYKILDDHINGNGPPLVILGDSGSGKSALLGNWVLRYMTFTNNKSAGWKRLIGLNTTINNYPLIVHFVGSTPQSSDCMAMIRRIMGDLKRYFNLKGDIPDRYDILRQEFASLLYEVAAKGKVIIIIDAINQLEDHEGALDLTWLPPEIPPNIRLIISTLPGRITDNLRCINHTELIVKPFSNEEKKNFIIKYFTGYSKSLGTKFIDKIALSKQTANPLYLKILLNELKVYGDHFTLPDIIDHYLTSQSINDLLQKVLTRYEKDYEDDRKHLVRDCMTYLLAARDGLTEQELLEILGTKDEPLPQAFWSPFYLSSETLLVNRSGRFSFAHQYVKQAVENKYLTKKEFIITTHKKLADYFTEQSLNKRKLTEYPWQLLQAKQYEKLFMILSDDLFLKHIWDFNSYNVKEYWTAIESNTNLRITDAYEKIIHNPKDYDIALVNAVLSLIKNAGYITDSTNLSDALIKLYSKSDELIYAALLNDKTRDLMNYGIYEQALDCSIQSERICIKYGHLQGVAASLINRASIFRIKGSLEEALQNYKKAESLITQTGSIKGLAECLHDQGNVLCSCGRLDEGLLLFKRAEKIQRENGFVEGLTSSLASQAFIYDCWGDHEGALNRLKEVEGIARKLGNLQILRVCLSKQGVILRNLGDLDKAMTLLKEEESICIKINNKEALAKCLGHQAPIIRDKGYINEALIMHKKEESILRAINSPDGVRVSLTNQGIILKAQGKYNDAMELFLEAEKISVGLNNPEGIAVALANQGVMLMQNMSKPKEALEVLERAVKPANDSQNVELIKQIAHLINYVRFGVK